MTRTIQISVDSQSIEGDLEIPERAAGVVVFAHGSGSDRRSPRNRFVAEALNRADIGTLLIDLLSRSEKAEDLVNPAVRFDIGRLAVRLTAVTDWLREDPEHGDLHVGYFGSSTGAAAALFAAKERPGRVDAIVSRGGRTDMAKVVLPLIETPTLLIVGGADHAVLEMNHEAFKHLGGEKRLEVVPGAGHLFDEPGAMDEVVRLTLEWFGKYLTERSA